MRKWPASTTTACDPSHARERGNGSASPLSILARYNRLMAASTDRLSGTFWLLYLYDVCDEILQDELRALLGAQPAGREPSFRQPTPDYVRFQKPPVIQYLEPLVLETGERFERQLHYYEYGVVSV